MNTLNSAKYAAEIKFWKEEIDLYVCWWQGKLKEFYGVPAPTEAQRITRHDSDRMNALDTWVNADRWRYCKHLFIEPTYWSGKVVLEIGCGPLNLARWLAGATVIGVDPLIDEYIEMGYPNTLLENECGTAECIDFGDDMFDAAFSVNAIDHVDDFAKAISEVERVTKPSGEIRIEVHYHRPTTTEPHSLSDDVVKSAFSKFDMRKISESPSTKFYPPGTHPQSDRFALWSNVDYLYDACEALS